MDILRHMLPAKAVFVNWLAAILLGVPMGSVCAQRAEDPVLIENSVAQIRRSDYERELMRLPAEARDGFGNSRKRVEEVLRRMLVTRVLAQQARTANIDQDPETAARIASEIERYLARLQLQAVEVAAAAEFDADPKTWEARAREYYLANRGGFNRPEQLRASHILFDVKRHSPEEAERLARDWRARIAAGEDFNDVAARVSEDPTAGSNAGRLNWFTREEMDPAFAEAAFKLGAPGEVSAPVRSRFGWHLVRLDERRPAGSRSFEEARSEILQELKRKFVGARVDAYTATIRADPGLRVDEAAVAAIIPKAPDQETIRRALEKYKASSGAPPASMKAD